MMLEMPTAEPLQAAADEPGTGEELPPAPKIEFNVQAEPSLAGNSIAAGMQGSVKQPMDDDLEKEMPYLYSERKDRMNPAESIAFAQPLGDAAGDEQLAEDGQRLHHRVDGAEHTGLLRLVREQLLHQILASTHRQKQLHPTIAP